MMTISQGVRIQQSQSKKRLGHLNGLLLRPTKNFVLFNFSRRKLMSQPVYLLCTYLSACYYEKAREIAVKLFFSRKPWP